MTPHLAVLDTNVVLDWLVFGNRGVTPLAQAIATGAITWLGCAAMRAELAHVLGHARLNAFSFDSEQVLTSVDRLCRMGDLPFPLPLPHARCSDPSDQMFVDLALTHGARWLLTRDRALLKLARNVLPRGLIVQVPEAWGAAQATP